MEVEKSEHAGCEKTKLDEGIFVISLYMGVGHGPPKPIQASATAS